MAEPKPIDGAKVRIDNLDLSHPWRRDMGLRLVVPGRDEPVELGLEHLRVRSGDELEVCWWSVFESYPELWEDGA